jgi:hypothetical protein
MIELPNYTGLDIRAFSKIFQRQGLTNSYKLFFFKAILESCKKGDTIVTFEKLFDDMFNQAFPLVHIYKLTFGSLDLLERIIKDYPNHLEGDLKARSSFMSNIDDDTKSNIISSYVIYRLLRPFYENFDFSPSDSIINKQLHQLINMDNNSLYYIDLNSKSIIINNNWISYINQHLKIIEEWYKYNLIVFLQSRNPSTPNIPFKVDSSLVSRNLTKETKIWQFAIDRNPIIAYDIYLSQIIDIKTTSEHGKMNLDHVIPFNFVMHNELWNLTPIHNKINSMKSNHLPHEQHILEFSKLQYSFFKTVQTFYQPKVNQSHPLEVYGYLNSTLSPKNFEIHEDEFTQILVNQLTSLKTIANNQGFSLWNNK